MEKKVAKGDTTVSSMEKRIKRANAKEEQLLKEKEHEMLVKAYIERKNEINEKEKSGHTNGNNLTTRT